MKVEFNVKALLVKGFKHSGWNSILLFLTALLDLMIVVILSYIRAHYYWFLGAGTLLKDWEWTCGNGDEL